MLREELGPFLLLLQAPRVLPVLGQRLALLAEAAAPSLFSAPGIGTGPSFMWVSAAIWKSQLWVVNSQREGLFPSWASVGGSEAAPILGFSAPPSSSKTGHPAASAPGIFTARESPGDQLCQWERSWKQAIFSEGSKRFQKVGRVPRAPGSFTLF